MRSFCQKCHNAADFIDLNTFACEHCLADLGQEAVDKSRLISRQTSDGATAVARLRVALATAKEGSGRNRV